MKDAIQPRARVQRLSLRQRQVLHYIIQGCHNKTIAHLLGVQLVTVKMHVGLLFKKLGVRNRTKAAVVGVVALYDGPSSGELADRLGPASPDNATHLAR